MNGMGIHTGGDLKKLTRFEMVQHFGKSGSYYFDIVRGIDNRPVKVDRIRKSLGVERTLEFDLSTYEEAEVVLEKILIKFKQRLEKADNYGRTLTLKLKSKEFKLITRSLSKPYYINSFEEIKSIAKKLLETHMEEAIPLRLIGISASNLQKEAEEGIDEGQTKLEF